MIRICVSVEYVLVHRTSDLRFVACLPVWAVGTTLDR